MKKEGSKKLFGIRISAIAETVVFLLIMVFLNFAFSDGSRFIDYSLHPFWIIILLVTVQYGTAEGMFAVILSTIVLYAYNIPELKGGETLFEYQLRVGLLPILWFITAFVLGELRMRIEWENERLRSSFLKAKAEVSKITSEYMVLKETNENLEVNLSSQETTVAESFRVFKALEALQPAQVITGVGSIIEIALHPQKFSVFAKGPNGLEAVTSEGWEPTDKYTRRFIPTSPLYIAIALKKQLLVVVNKLDQKILENEGVLAAPLVDPQTGEVFGMVKVEAMQFLNLNLSRIETFKIVCELIGQAYANAKKHKSAQTFNLYAFPNLLYANNLYKIEEAYLKRLSKDQDFDLSAIHIQLKSNKTFDEDFLQKLIKILPDSVHLFEGSRKNRDLSILLPFSKNQEVKEIKNQIDQWLANERMLSAEDYQVQLETLNG